jgi:release factor H-coupled RctB family protein
MLLVASSGADFVGYTKNKAQKQKEIDDIVVGLHGSDISGEKAPVQCVVRLIAKHSRVEDEAVKQMEATAKLPRMRMVVGLPDLHPGKGFPIGSASVSEDVIYPHLVGADIGCGMSLYKTSLKSRKLKLDQWTDSLHGLEEAWGGGSIWA